MTKRTIVTLFSGFEGFGVGAHAAGYTHLWGVEFNPKLAAVAETNGFHTLVDDVRAVDYASLPRPDHLHASPVCKNASVAKTDGAESPEDLETAQAVCRAIEALRPDSFTLENVRGYSKFASFNAIVATLRRLGYGVTYAVLNSADYGVPQTRERLILRAVAGQERPALPTPTHARADKIAPWLDTRLPWVGWLEAIADLVDALPDSAFAPWQLKRLPHEICKSLAVRATDSSTEVLHRASDEPLFTVLGVSRGIPRAVLIDSKNVNQEYGKLHRLGSEPSITLANYDRPSHMPRALLLSAVNADGTTLPRTGDDPSFTLQATAYKQMPRAWVVDCQDSRAASGRTVSPDAAPMFTLSASMEPRRPARAYLTQLQGNARGDWRADNEPAKTLAAGIDAHQHNLASAGRVVKLSPRCLARLQSFPDSYALPERAALACEGIGNAVPCLLAQRIMELAND